MTDTTLAPRVGRTPPLARSSPTTPTPGQRSLAKSVALHLYPGLALAAFVVLTAPTIESWGMPALFALLMMVAVFVLNGVVGPVVEELHVRGHLLPRIDRFGHWAPVLNTVLFALYHLWTPWRWPQDLIGSLPSNWPAWRKRTVWLPMLTHVMVNLAFSLLLVAAYLGALS